jgi:hypothetical protein
MSRQEIIDILEELMERMKWEGVQDATEKASNKAIYAMEDAVQKLAENEE